MKKTLNQQARLAWLGWGFWTRMEPRTGKKQTTENPNPEYTGLKGVSEETIGRSS